MSGERPRFKCTEIGYNTFPLKKVSKSSRFDVDNV
jgi:hypothetical protein